MFPEFVLQLFQSQEDMNMLNSLNPKWKIQLTVRLLIISLLN